MRLKIKLKITSLNIMFEQASKRKKECYDGYSIQRALFAHMPFAPESLRA
jgi:hypothetical protein